MPKSKYMLFKYVTKLCPLSPATAHFYCSKCLFYLGDKLKECRPTLCGSKPNKFFQLSLAEQIKNLFENHNLSDMIEQYTTSRESDATTIISSICDGQEFRRVHHGGRYDLVLLGHTDGVSVSKSSAMSFWPLEFVICQLDPRYLQFRHVLIAGVWLDVMKPRFNSYLKPFVQELKDLYHKGIKWTHPRSNTELTSYVSAPGFCGDAPVRSDLQNILGHGGIHCCNTCEEKKVKLEPGEATNQTKNPNQNFLRAQEFSVFGKNPRIFALKKG